MGLASLALSSVAPVAAILGIKGLPKTGGANRMASNFEKGPPAYVR